MRRNCDSSVTFGSTDEVKRHQEAGFGIESKEPSSDANIPDRPLDQNSRFVWSCILSWRKHIFFFALPLLFSPLPLASPGKVSQAAYIILILACYWVLEVFPIEVTAIFPMVLFPLFGILPAKEVSGLYFADTNMIFLGGLIMAVAIEHWNLHKRLALKVLLIFGTKPERLLLGFMVVTAFISMFVSDTATSAMMMPIGEAVLTELEEDEEKCASESMEGHTKIDAEGALGETMYLVTNNESAPLVNTEVKTNTLQNFSKGLMLAISYSSLIGGTATLTGTGPNLVLAGQLDRLYKNGQKMTYMSWSVFAFPQMLILLLVAWLYMTLIVVRVRCVDLLCCQSKKIPVTAREKRVQEIIERQYVKLGPMKFAEKAVLGHFTVLVMLWLLRDPKIFPGWSSAFRYGYVSDGTTALMVTIFLFIFPAEKIGILCRKSEMRAGVPPKPLLTWQVLVHKLPWGIIILLGGGFAIAEACEKSGLSHWVGEQLVVLQALPPFAVVLISCAMVTAFTEISSNSATATIFIPILASLAVAIKVHPWYLMIPATISASFAFMLPISTPPNAIVFSTGRLSVKDMITFGFGLDILGLVILNVCINTFGNAYYNFDSFPEWAKNSSFNVSRPT